uniref:F-box domain-containing protein n=1 Tax=Graphocephala atropunctata TaxID=36148 RepID=A0A1B6LRU6_9HEMI
MAGEVSWNNLPSVILNEVFSYLSHNDKVRASSTCKNWRFALSHPRCWRNVHFVIKPSDKSNDIARTRYLVDCAARKLHNASVTFDSMDLVCVQETSNVVESLSENANLRRLFFKPSNCSLVCPGEQDDWPKYIERHFGIPLISAVRKSHHLEMLSLGCLEELVSSHAKAILENIVQKHASSITVLGLASIKDYPDNYFITDLNVNLLKPLKQLQILSLDYCHVNDNLLYILSEACTLTRLVVHVHGIMEEHPGTSEVAWSTLTRNLPNCELRLTLIHSYDGVDVLHSKILKRAMPLTHLKVFFCEKLNVEAVHQLSFYSETLRSIWWVDSMSCRGNSTLLQELDTVNPFIMCCWRCHNLEELVFLGHKYQFLDVYAVIRLRGATLRHLCLAAADIAFHHHQQCVSQLLEDLEQDITNCLKKPWTSLVEPQLHPVIWNSDAGDSDEFVLPIVLQDIEP